MTLISLGGTIASVPTTGRLGVTPQLGADDLLGTIGEVIGDVAVEVVTTHRVPSGDLRLDDVVELARDVRRRLEHGTDGVVVAQGTDTLEEVAFALDLLVRDDRPVVVTGAMRLPSDVGADGPANLLGAITVALSPAARALGVVVAFNDEVHAARFVRKTNTTNVATFASPTTGPVGRITEGLARIYLRPPRLYDAVDLERVDRVPPVSLFSCAIGDDGRLLDTARDHGFAGVVVEGFGGGHVPAAMVRRLSELAEHMPVILASRTGGGDVLATTYGYDGSERDLLDRGLVSAGFLDGRKARVFLSLLLGAGCDTADVADAFGKVHQSATSTQ